MWPDQTERFRCWRPRSTWRADFPVTIDRADIPGWLAEQLDEPVPDRATVVFHSIVWQYLTDDERADGRGGTFARRRQRATADAPLAWLRLEPAPDLTHAELRLTTWPGGEERLLARATYHVGPVQWLA